MPIAQLGNHPNYFAELKKWYRKNRVYHDLDVRFYVEVTYFSPTLVPSYVAEYAKTYRLDAQEQQRLLEEEIQKAANHETFYISLFAPEKNWDRLDGGENIWRLRATSLPHNSETAPLRIAEISMDDPKLGYFFPYVEKWARHYKVTFPKGQDATGMLLTMEGVVGSQSFRW